MKCLPQQQFSLSSYTLEPFREQDLLLIKKWRNAQINVLRQKAPLTNDDQKRYWKEHILPTFSEEWPPHILFSYLKDEVLIGYGGLTHIDWNCRRAEVSFLLNPIYKEESQEYAKAFAVFLTLIKKIAFSSLHLHRLFTETFDIRPHHVAILEREGFVLEGRLKEHILVGNHFVDTLIHGVLQ